MKHNITLTIIFCSFAICGFVLMRQGKPGAGLVNNFRTEHENPADGIRQYAEYEFTLLKNPRTGTIPPGTYAAEEAAAAATEKIHGNAQGSSYKTTGPGTWTFKGPSNLGGRTRAIGIDVGNNSIILAGNVSGGVSRTTNGGASWTNVTPTGNIKNITSIAQDTRSGQTSTWYFCTGEGFGNSASLGNGAFYLGNGVYKSTDNGITWARLSGSNAGVDEAFDDDRDICSRIVVNPANGDVYLAATNNIYRSQNGGTSWSSVLGGGATSTFQFTDIVITTGGTLYAAFSGGAGPTLDGVWTSTTGSSASWTRIANSASVTGWNATGFYGRVVLALAPSVQTTLYALFDRSVTSSCAGTPAPEAKLFVYDATVPAWTDLSANLPDESGCLEGNDPFAVQSGYDLCIAVKPNSATTVFIGGTNLYRSTNGFTSTAATTRIGGYFSSSTYFPYTGHHPDIHELKFASGSNSILYSGDDGGIQSADITVATPSWTSLNNSYPSYQYYDVALDPATGSTKTIGGAQDNGTTSFGSGLTTGTFLFSGDGCSVGMTSGGTVNYLSTQVGEAYRDNFPGIGNIEPASNKSLFVTNFHLDPDNTPFLYYANGNDLYRTASASTVTSGSGWSNLTGLASAITTSFKIYGIATSRGGYSTNTGIPATLSRLYVGTGNGELFRLDDPQNVAVATAPANITPTGMTGTGNVLADIAVDPTDSRKVMAVYSNYGISSVWYTGDASAASPTWTNVEGNIAVFSFRSVAILSNGVLTDYLVGTSKGLYSTNVLNGASTVWLQEASTLIGNLPVVSLDYRTSDQTILAGSHGNGMFISQAFPLPINFISFDARLLSSEIAKLSWTVVGEKSISAYEMQRSSDGKNWESFGSIQASNSGAYSGNDDLKGRKGTIFYRIRAIEFNGDAFTSVVQSVNIPASFVQAINIYPTIVSQFIHVTANSPDYTAVLSDLQGRRLAAVRLNAGDNTRDLSMLNAGQYIVSVYENGRLISSSRIVKQ